MSYCEVVCLEMVSVNCIIGILDSSLILFTTVAALEIKKRVLNCYLISIFVYGSEISLQMKSRLEATEDAENIIAEACEQQGN